MLNKIPNNFITYSFLSLIGILIVSVGIYLNTDLAIFESSDFSLLNIGNFKSFLLNTSLFILEGIVAFLIFRQINSTYKYVENKNLTIAFFTIVGYSTINFVELHLPTGVGFLFLVLAIQINLKVHNQKDVRGILFLSGFLVGIGSLFFLPVLFGLLPILLNTAVFRPFSLRNYLVIFVGSSLPFIYFISIGYLFDFNFHIPDLSSNNSVTREIFAVKNLPALIYLMLALFSLSSVLISRSKFIVRQRNQLVILITYLVLVGFFLFIVSIGQLVFFTIPLFGWFIGYLHKKIPKPWILELFGLVLLIFAIWVKL